MKHTRNGRAKPPEKKNSPVRVRKQWWETIIVEYYMKGNNQQRTRELASEKTGHPFSRGFVNKAIAKAVDEWKESKQDWIDNHKAIELEKINRLEMTAWDAWERSTRVEIVKKDRKVKGKDGGKLATAMTENTTRPNSGDPRFLQTIQWCTEQRCKILGIEVPQPSVAIQVNNNNSGTGSQSTTINRRIVFKTRETTVAPQVITEPANDE
jgi:hypothetical protein